MVFLKEFFEKVNFEKISRRQKSMKKFPGGNGALCTKTLCAGQFGFVYLEMEISCAGLKDFFHY